MNNFAVKNKLPIQTFDLSDFSQEVEIASEIINVNNSIGVQKSPVLLYPSINVQKPLLLIDGNTRYAFALKNNLKYIETIKITVPTPNDFITSLDWLEYSFIKDFLKTTKILSETSVQFRKWESNLNFILKDRQNKY